MSLYSSFLTGRLFAYFRYRLRFPSWFRRSGLPYTSRNSFHSAFRAGRRGDFHGDGASRRQPDRGRRLVGTPGSDARPPAAFAKSGERDAAELEIGRWFLLGAVAALATIVGGLVLHKASLAGEAPVGRFTRS